MKRTEDEQQEQQPLLLETRELTKRYGRVTALDRCTLRVKQGEVFGLLGPNGAGKTTLIRLLLGYLRPTSGSATIGGLNCVRQSVKVRGLVSYLPAEARLFRQMTARDVLDFFAHVRPNGSLSRSEAIAKRLELDLSRRVAYMSTGMRQKLAMSAALSSATPLLIMDEPTSNLDPTIRRIVGELVLEARDAGRTILLSSHVLSEVEEVCDRVVIMRDGTPVHLQKLSELKKQHRIRAITGGPLSEAPRSLQKLFAIRQENEQLWVEGPGDLTPLLAWLSNQPLRELRIEPVGLRTVYDRFHSESQG